MSHRPIEGPPESVDGLGMLDVETVMTGDKSLVEVAGTHRPTGEPVRGYEMHVGRTDGPDLARPLLDLAGRTDGATSPDGRVAGCYVHGLFAADGFRRAFLGALKARTDSGLRFDDAVDAALDALADHLEAHVDLEAVLAIARGR